MLKLFIFIIKTIAKVTGTLFGKRFAQTFASFLKFFGLANLLTFLKFKRYIDVIASFLYYFASKVLLFCVLLRKLVKNDITLLTGLLSLAKYFNDKLPFKFFMKFIIKTLEIFTLFALISTILHFDDYTIKSIIEYIDTTYSDLKEYFNTIINKMYEFVYTNYISFKNTIKKWINSFLGIDNVLESSETPTPEPKVVWANGKYTTAEISSPNEDNSSSYWKYIIGITIVVVIIGGVVYYFSGSSSDTIVGDGGEVVSAIQPVQPYHRAPTTLEAIQNFASDSGRWLYSHTIGLIYSGNRVPNTEVNTYLPSVPNNDLPQGLSDISRPTRPQTLADLGRPSSPSSPIPEDGDMESFWNHFFRKPSTILTPEYFWPEKSIDDENLVDSFSRFKSTIPDRHLAGQPVESPISSPILTPIADAQKPTYADIVKGNIDAQVAAAAQVEEYKFPDWEVDTPRASTSQLPNAPLEPNIAGNFLDLADTWTGMGKGKGRAAFLFLSSLAIRAQIWKLLNYRVICLVLLALIYKLLIFIDAISLPSTSSEVLLNLTFILWINDNHIEEKKQLNVDFNFANLLKYLALSHWGPYGYKESFIFNNFDSLCLAVNTEEFDADLQKSNKNSLKNVFIWIYMVLSRLDPVYVNKKDKKLNNILNITNLILRKNFNLSILELEVIELFGYLYSNLLPFSQYLSYDVNIVDTREDEHSSDPIFVEFFELIEDSDSSDSSDDENGSAPANVTEANSSRPVSNLRDVRDVRDCVVKGGNYISKRFYSSKIPKNTNIKSLNDNSNTPFQNDNIEMYNEYLKFWNMCKNKGIIEKKELESKIKSKLYYIFFNEPLLLDYYIIRLAINEFWEDVMSKLQENEYVIILFKVLYTETSEAGVREFWATFDKVNKIIKEDQDKYIETLWNILDIKDSRYLSNSVNQINIEYWIKENNTGKPLHLLSTLKNTQKIKNPEKKLNVQTNKISNFNIPLNRNYESWGTVISNKNNKFIEIQDKFDKDKYYHVNNYKNYSKIDIKINVNEIIQSFEDHDHLGFIKIYPKINKNMFVRVINNLEIVIDESKSEIVLKSINTKTDFLKHINKEKKINNKLITLDIETRVVNNNDIGQHVPYCVCYSDGKFNYSFYVTDFKDHQDMLKEAILSLLKPKYSGYSIYVHNLSNFDGIFLLNILASLISDNVKINPIIREDKIIDIKINYGPNSKYNISFTDSLLLLPSSLEKLSKAFGIEHLKTSFPHNFLNDKLNKNLDLNYIGNIPNVKYFENPSNFNNFFKDYIKDNKKSLFNWNLREEAIKYCVNDCVALHEVLTKFNEFIFNKFKLNIHSYPTIPSLTFAIFRSNYLKNIFKKGYYIPLINGKLYESLKESYTGGSVDMFLPSNKNIKTGKRFKVNCYDVNSLYPKNMDVNMFMPVLSKQIKYVTYFEGDISLLKDNAYGFFNVDVETTKELDHPILQLHYKTGHGFNTISPLGSWNYMYFSEELYNSEKYGYKYKINNGYLFDRYNIFGDFIAEMYKIKEDTKGDKNNPWYIISKLLMNSLYGRFGMNPNMETHSIINFKDLDSYLDKYEVISYKELVESNIIINNFITRNTNNKILISYKDNNNLDNTSSASAKKNKSKNVSIVIASAITSYARIFMSFFKNNSNFILLYTDTDSIFIHGKLDPSLIGNKLGQWKKENTYIKFVALAPKVYGGVTEDGREIVKIKGFKNILPFYDLEELLNKDKSLDLHQEKWYKSIKDSNILIKDEIYTLTPTENKRQLIYKLIYNKNKFVNTKPFILFLVVNTSKDNKEK